MEFAQEILKNQGITISFSQDDRWRQISTIFKCRYENKNHLIKVIDTTSQQGKEEEEQFQIGISNKTNSLLSPLILKKIEIEGKIFILLKRGENSLKTLLRQHEGIVNPMLAVQFALQLLNSIDDFRNRGMNLQDQIPDTLAFEDQRIYLRSFISIKDENLRDHVYNRYVEAISGGRFFAYPPETLSQVIYISKAKNIERDEAGDVWAIAALLFVMLGGSKKTILNLADIPLRYKGIKELSGYLFSSVFSKQFQSDKRRRLSKTQFIDVLKEILEKMSINDSNNSKIKEEEKSFKYEETFERKSVDGLFTMGKLHSKKKEYDAALSCIKECLENINKQSSEPASSLDSKEVGAFQEFLQRKIGKSEEADSCKALHTKDPLHSEKPMSNKKFTFQDIQASRNMKSGDKWEKQLWNEVVLKLIPRPLKKSEIKILMLSTKICIDSIVEHLLGQESAIQIDNSKNMREETFKDGMIRTYNKILKSPISLCLEEFFFLASKQAELLNDKELSIELKNQMIDIAQSFYDFNLLETTIFHLNQISKIDPQNYEATLLAGQIFYQKGEIKEAVKCSNKAIQMRPNSPQGFLLKGKCLLKQGLENSEIEKFEKQLITSISKEEFYTLLGKMIEQNLISGKQDMEPNPQNLELNKDSQIFKIGEYCFQQKMYSIAFYFFNKCLELNPIQKEVNYQLAQICIQQLNYEEAIKRYFDEIKLNKNHTLYYHQLSELQIKCGHTEEAILTLQNCIQEGEYCDKTYLMLINLLQGQNQIDELDKLLEQYENTLNKIIDGNDLINQAYDSLKKKEKDKAASFLISAIHNFLDNPAMGYKVACIYFDFFSNFTEAQIILQGTISKFPYFYHYRFKLALIYLKLKKFDLAQNELLVVVKSNPNHCQALFELGKLEFQAKKYQNAYSYLKRSIKINTTFGIYAIFGKVSLKVGKLRNAFECIKVSREVESENENEIDYIYAKCLILNEKYDQAQTMFSLLYQRSGVKNKEKILYFLTVANNKLSYRPLKYFETAILPINNQNLRLKVAKAAFISLSNSQDNKLISNVVQKLETYIQKQTDQDLLALQSQIMLNLGKHPFLAIKSIETVLGQRFNENKLKDTDLTPEKQNYFGCLIMEAKIWYLLGKPERALDLVIQFRNRLQIHYEKSQLLIIYPIKTIEQKKLNKSNFNLIDWRNPADILLAQIYISLKRYEDAEAIIKQIQERDSSERIQKNLNFLQAISLLNQNKNKEGIDLLRKNESHIPSFLKLGTEMMEQKQFEEAQKVAKELDKSKESDLDILLFLGNLNFEIKNFTASRNYFSIYETEIKSQNKILKSFKTNKPRKIEFNKEEIVKMACCLFELKFYKESEDKLTLIINEFPENSLALYYLGKNKIQNKEYSEAIKLLNRSLKIDKKAETLFQIGTCYKFQNKLEEAIKILYEAESLDSNNHLILGALGEIFLKEKEYKKGREYFQKSLTINPNDETSLIGVAQCYWRDEKDLLEAEKYFKQSMEANKDSELSFIELIKFYKQTDRFPDPTFIKSFKKLFEKSVPNLYYLGSIFFEAALNDSSLYETTFDFFKLLIDLPDLKNSKEEHSLTNFRLSQIYFLKQEFTVSFQNLSNYQQIFKNEKLKTKAFNNKQHQFEEIYLEAKLRFILQKPKIDRLILKSSKLFLQNPLPYFTFAFYLVEKKSNSAWKFLQKGISLSSDDPKMLKSEQVLVLQGIQAYKQKQSDLKLAKKIFEECISTYPKSSLALFHQGNCHFESNEYLLAIPFYENCIESLKSSLSSLTSECLTKQDSTKCQLYLAQSYFKIKKNDQSLLIINNILKVQKNHSEALQLQSEIYFQANKYLDAIQSAHSSLRDNNQNLESLYILAQANLKSGNTITSISILERCISIDPQYKVVSLKIATIYEAIERPEKSLHFILTYLSQFPNSALGLFKSSKLLTHFEKFHLADQHINRLFTILKERVPSNKKQSEIPKQLNLTTILDDEELFRDSIVNLKDAYIISGYFQKQAKDLPEAILQYQQALSLDPQNEESLFSLALIYSELGNYQEVISYYKQLLRLKISSKKLQNYHINLGNAFKNINHLNKAIQEYVQAIGLKEECSLGVYSNIAECYILQKQFDSALYELEKALQIDKFNEEALTQMSKIHYQKGDSAKAIKILEKVISNSPYYVPAFYLLAKIKKETGKVGEAIKICQSCLVNSKRNQKMMLYLSDCLIKSGDYWGALSILNQILTVIQIEQNYATKSIYLNSNIQIFRIYVKLNEIDKALDHIQSCLKESPDNPAYLYELGTLEMNYKKNLPEALSLFRQVSNACPENPLYLESIAMTFDLMNQPSLAIEAYQRCLDLNPSNSDQIWNNIALNYRSLYQSEQAIIAFEKGLKINPNSSLLHLNIGNLFLKQRNLKQAVLSYERCISLDSSCLSAFNNLALVSLQLKNYQRSADCFSRCMEIDHKNKHQYSERLKLLLNRGYCPNNDNE